MNWPTEQEIGALYIEWLDTKDLSGHDLINMTIDLIKAKNPETTIEWPDWANWIVLDREAWYYCNQKPVTGNRTFYIPGKAEQIFNYDIEKHLEKLVWRKPWNECIIKKPGATE